MRSISQKVVLALLLALALAFPPTFCHVKAQDYSDVPFEKRKPKNAWNDPRYEHGVYWPMLRDTIASEAFLEASLCIYENKSYSTPERVEKAYQAYRVVLREYPVPAYRYSDSQYYQPRIISNEIHRRNPMGCSSQRFDESRFSEISAHMDWGSSKYADSYRSVNLRDSLFYYYFKNFERLGQPEISDFWKTEPDKGGGWKRTQHYFLGCAARDWIAFNMEPYEQAIEWFKIYIDLGEFYWSASPDDIMQYINLRRRKLWDLGATREAANYALELAEDIDENLKDPDRSTLSADEFRLSQANRIILIDMVKEIKAYAASLQVELATKTPANISIEEIDATGSAVLIHGKNGCLVTNSHVIEGATSIQLYHENHGFISAEVGNNYPDLDIAILRVYDGGLDFENSSTVSSLAGGVVVENSMELGEEVTTMGYPKPSTLGFDIKLSRGIVSSERFAGIPHLFGIDASIAPGSSGGAVFNKSGHLIGITSVGSKETSADYNGAIKSIFLDDITRLTGCRVTKSDNVRVDGEAQSIAANAKRVFAVIVRR